MNQLRSVILICLIAGLFFSCGESGNSGSAGALKFEIEGLTDNLLIIESDTDVSITYTSNTRKPDITLTVYPATSDLTLDKSANPIIAHAAAAAKGMAYRITADVTSGKRSTQTVFSIYVNDGANLDDGIASITMTNPNPYEIDASKQWDLEYTITPAAFQYAATITYSIVPPPPQPAAVI